MIDFRYHLVSIVAIFLALATGVVLGGVALDGSRVHDLRQRAAGLQQQRDRLQADHARAQQQAGADRALVTAIIPRLTAGALRSVAVSVVLAPGAGDAELSAARRIVAQGGGTVAATVRLAPALTETAQTDLVDGVTNRVVPGGAALPAGSAQLRAAVVLSAALTGRPAPNGPGPAGTQLDGSQALTVLQAYAEAKLLSLPGPPGSNGGPTFAPSGTVLLVLPAAAATDRATQALDAALAHDLAQRSSATVVAAPTGGLPTGLGPAGDAHLSTVDGIETPQGQLIAVLTLAATGHGPAGSYGASTGAIPPMLVGAPVSPH